MAASFTFLPITTSPYRAGTSPVPRAALNARKYPSVVSTMWAAMSRVDQPSQAVGASQASGR